MELIIALIIGIICGIPIGWIGSDINDNFKPPKTMKQEIITTVDTTVTSQNEMRNYQVQETKVYNGLSNQQFLFAITNQTAYSNLLKSIITNDIQKKIITNETNYYAKGGVL